MRPSLGFVSFVTPPTPLTSAQLMSSRPGTYIFTLMHSFISSATPSLLLGALSITFGVFFSIPRSIRLVIFSLCFLRLHAPISTGIATYILYVSPPESAVFLTCKAPAALPFSRLMTLSFIFNLLDLSTPYFMLPTQASQMRGRSASLLRGGTRGRHQRPPS